MKKIFAIVLALVMCFLSVNVTAFAAENEMTVDAVELMPLDTDVTALPYGDVNTSSVMVSFTGEENELSIFSYITDTAGDYNFNFTNLHAYVGVYDVNAAEWIYDECDTEYVAQTAWAMRDRLTFYLKANTAYYICVLPYRASTTRLSVTKNVLAVSNIVPTMPAYELNSSWLVSDLDRYAFHYELTYEDGTGGKYTCAAIEKAGYILFDPLYVGKVIPMHDEDYLAHGTQSVKTAYNGQEYTYYFTVKSLTDWLVENNYNAVVDDAHCVITYETENVHTYFWRIKMSDSGYFAVWRDNTDDFGTNFAYYSMEIVDKNGSVTAFDGAKGAWPLIAGEEYMLSFQYQYNPSYSYNNIEFWFQKESDLRYNGWVKVGNRWYIFEKGNLVKNGWRKDSKGWVYVGADGAMVTNKWVKDSKGWCYVGENGYAVTNCWKKDSHGWIYLDANGSMTKSKWVKTSGKWYYLDANGYMVTNKWQKDSKGWVYVGADGAMVTNKWVKDSKGWCYVGADGYAVTNCWKKDSKGWIYLDANGSMTKSKWVKDSGRWYYCDANGYMVANKTLIIGGKKYTFNAAGVWVG